jgi:hypothetical protein
MNAIIYRNYLHLARLLPEQHAAALATLLPLAVLSYRHLNLHGEDDFSDQPMPLEAPFDMGLVAAKQTCVALSRRFYPICLTTPQLAEGHLTEANFQHWLARLPPQMRQAMTAAGFAAANRSWSFRRHVLERRGLFEATPLCPRPGLLAATGQRNRLA